MTNRLNFIDAARGLAILPMVINHAAHAWLPENLVATNPKLFYLTETTAAPLFMFIAGFSLALSWSRAHAQNIPKHAWMKQTAVRAVSLIITGYLLNLILFPGNYLLLMGPLQTIGLSTLILIPAAAYLSSRNVAHLLALPAVACYGLFFLKANQLSHSILYHPTLGEMFFFSMPPWPWISIVCLGAALGGRWCACTTTNEKVALQNGTCLIGITCILLALTLNCPDYTITIPGFTTWVPGAATALWMTGIIPIILRIAYHLEKLNCIPRYLLTFGRAALMIYVIHRLFIITIMAKLCHFTVTTPKAFIFGVLGVLLMLNWLVKQTNKVQILAKPNKSTA